MMAMKLPQEMDEAARHARRRGGQERQVVHGTHEAGALGAARRPEVRRGGDDPARRAHHGDARRAARAPGPGGAQREDEQVLALSAEDSYRSYQSLRRRTDTRRRGGSQKGTRTRTVDF